jgi:L-ascorbate metabolism protein UlaG (beta-lactamase superfamily)
MKRMNPVRITWLGHSAFRFDSPLGKIVLVDPWLDNPRAPASAREIDRVDLILVTHGHGDHLGNTVEIAKKTGAKVIAIHELALFLQNAGVSNAEGMNSSGIESGPDVFPGADPAGFVITFENGLKVYHAGDTGVFLDMKLIGELYKPDVAILPIGGLYTMGPREAAKACAFLKPRTIIGMHYGTFPPLSGTPEELRKLLPPEKRKRVKTLEPGVTSELP